jgi:hypothetical protein
LSSGLLLSYFSALFRAGLALGGDRRNLCYIVGYYRCYLKSPKSRAIRRSVVLPQDVVAEARAAAPEELRDNLNRLVVVSLREYAERRRAEAFVKAMEEMGADPAIQTECRRIEREFAGTEADGLENG